MNLGRIILTVSLVLTLASCLDTGARDDSPSAMTPIAKARPTPPEESAPAKSVPSTAGADGQTSSTTRNAASGVNGGNGNAGSAKKQDGKTGAGGQSSSTTRNVASGANGGNAGSARKQDGKAGAGGQTASTTRNAPSGANSGNGATDSTKARDKKTGGAGQTAAASPNTATGAGATGTAKARDAKIGGVAVAAPAGKPDKPGKVVVLEPDNQGAPAGGATANATGGEIVPTVSPSFEERSVNCDVIEIMGKAIGRRRSLGEGQKTATNEAIDEVIRQTGEVRDNRFVFSGRVYGMLIYNLRKDHTADGFGAYAFSACLILRGGKAVFIPADKASVTRLEQALKTCESGSPSDDKLKACISESMEDVVRQRGAWSG